MAVHQPVQGILPPLGLIQDHESILQQTPCALQKQTGLLGAGNQAGNSARVPLLLFKPPEKLYPHAVVSVSQREGDGMPLGVYGEMSSSG